MHREDLYTKEELELYAIVSKHVKWYSNRNQTNISVNGIFNSLLRGDIRSVDKLVAASPEDIAKIKYLGRGIKFGLVMALKAELEEELV